MYFVFDVFLVWAETCSTLDNGGWWIMIYDCTRCTVIQDRSPVFWMIC